MTTGISVEKKFLAIDSRWSFKGFLYPEDNYPVKKYLIIDDEIHVFAGHENPIIAEQARLLEIIDDLQYLTILSNLTDESLESFVVSDLDGQMIDNNGHSYSNQYNQMYFIGSGGEHACDFFYWSKRKSYNSVLGCNANASMNYAKHKDEATGGKHNVKCWDCGGFYVSMNSDTGLIRHNNEYEELLSERVNDMLNKLNQSSDQNISNSSAMVASASPIASAYCSTGTTELTKVSLSSSISRMQRREERKKNKEASLK